MMPLIKHLLTLPNSTNLSTELKKVKVKLIFQLKKKPIEKPRTMMPMMMIKFLLRNFWSNLEREKLSKRSKKLMLLPLPKPWL